MPGTRKTIKLNERVVLHVDQAADRAGVRPKTFTGYVTRGTAPGHDDEIDARTPVWYPETIDAWLAGRRRKGRTKRA